MARSLTNAELATRTSRLKLRLGTRYFQKLGNGCSLIYRRTGEGFGNWSLKFRSIANDGTIKYSLRGLGAADDFEESNSNTVLTFYEAQQAARKVLSLVLGGAAKENVQLLTVADAATRYLAWYTINRKSVGPCTATIKAHILPRFGRIRLSDLKSDTIRSWHEQLALTPARKRAKAGEASVHRAYPTDEAGIRGRKASANRILTIFKALLNKAYAEDLVASDHAWRRVKPFRNVSEPVIRFLTTAESTRLINTCPGDLKTLVRAALCTGARFSELARLRVTDFSSETNLLYILPGKSGHGRYVPLNSEGIEFFGVLALGKTGNDLLITHSGGLSWERNVYQREFVVACARAKIEPVIRFHDLRHTYASLMAQAGADLLTISKLLGHSDTRITSKHYAHLCDKTLALAVNRFLPNFGFSSESNVILFREPSNECVAKLTVPEAAVAS